MKSSVICAIGLTAMLAASTAQAQSEPEFDPGWLAILVSPLIAAIALGQELSERFETGCIERGGSYEVTNLTYSNQWGCVAPVSTRPVSG